MIKIDNLYSCIIDEKTARIYRKGKYAGKVWIGETNEWNVQYAKGEIYLPINDVLPLLGYKWSTK